MEPIDKLLPHASALFRAPVGSGSAPPQGTLRGLYAGFNGGYFFGRALLIRPWYAFESQPLTVRRWNEPSLWRRLYDGLGAVEFFAEDAFGVQFGARDSGVFRFDPETAELTEASKSFEGWADTVLADSDYMTGAPTLTAWEATHSTITPGFRLVAKQPFVLGGECLPHNVVARPEVECMEISAGIYQAIKDVPDGTRVVLKISD